jgi:opacity protein-like surface antigen
VANPAYQGNISGAENGDIFTESFSTSANISAANLAYNIFAIGGGLDYYVLPRINVRAEYEYQQWLSFPPNGLTPKIFSVGAAYRFH